MRLFEKPMKLITSSRLMVQAREPVIRAKRGPLVRSLEQKEGRSRFGLAVSSPISAISKVRSKRSSS